MNTINIAIIGYGYVGKACEKYFKNKYNVIIYDPYYDNSCSTEELNKADIAVICVPTPSLNDGSCDVSLVEEYVSKLKCELIIIKSTVEIGTTQKLQEKYNKNLVFSPEYIGESNYDTGKYNFNKEMINSDFFIFGGNSHDTNKCVNLYTKISGPNKRYIQTDSTSAEIAKYMENSFLATKIIFCYEMDQICQSFGKNYTEVRELWLNDPRINSSHTAVFFDKTEPYDGKCLPKDISALVRASEKQNYTPEFLKEVINSNKRIGDIRKNI